MSRLTTRPTQVVAAVAAVLAFAMTAAPASAADPVCGATLTHSVKLQANMQCEMSATSGLVIGHDGITVDLNGHLIDGPGSGSLHYGIENSDGFARKASSSTTSTPRRR